MMDKQVYTIGQAASLSGFSRATIRRYERRGWIRPDRGWNGYRLFSAAQIHWLQAVRLGDVDPRSINENN